MMPKQPDSDPAPPETGDHGPGPVMVRPHAYHWYQKVWAVLMLTFCLEIGFFLLFFPWTTYWETNYFAQVIPAWHVYWYNDYVRGAVSGLGALNLYIGVLEVFRLRRFARRRTEKERPV